MMMIDVETGHILRAIYDAAIKDTSPRDSALRSRSEKPKGRRIVIGVGEA